MSGLDLKREIIEMWTDTSMTYEDVFFAMITIVSFDALKQIFAVSFRFVDESEFVFCAHDLCNKVDLGFKKLDKRISIFEIARSLFGKYEIPCIEI